MKLPEEIAGYRILDALGRGASGLVYRAEQPGTQRIVALKLLLEGLGGEAADDSLGEVEILARLDHPGIARVLDAGIVDLGLGAQAWFAMELVKGIPLDEAAEDRPLRERVQLVREACAAVEHAHRRGVIHRDLKPDNVLASQDARPKIVDFGIAQTADLETRSLASRVGVESLAGSLPYMSPDQVELPSDQLDVRVDVYALGALLYRVISGRDPLDFSQDAPLEALESIGSREPERLGRIVTEARGDLEAVIQTAMAKRREERYATAADLAADLDRWLDGHPVLARRLSPGARLRRQVLQYRLTLLAATLIAIALVGSTLAIRDNTRKAVESAERFESLAIGTRLERARQIADTLYPPWPSSIPDLESFLSEHGDPLARALDGLRTQRQSLTDAAPAPGTTDRFLQERLGGIVSELEAFVAPENGVLDSVRRRLDWARSIERRSVLESQAAWDRAIQALANDGLVLEPQIGLVPLGADPLSGLQEFAHLASGKPPVRDPDTGMLQLDEDAGIVFVLLPGGRATLGAQGENPDAPNYDPLVGSYEGTVQEIDLAPFFIGKHEISAAQWERLGGSSHESNPHLPAYHVDWSSADRGLKRHGLTLPTEAQWEYAARGGTDTPFWSGDDLELLQRSLNIRNIPAGQEVERAGPDGWEDAFRGLGVIDSMTPNPFGLHHVQGNVSEWCLDWVAKHAVAEVAPGTGERLGMSSGEKVYRGGSWYAWRTDARVTRRFAADPAYTVSLLGMRAARAVR